MMEESLTADFSLIRAAVADKNGNLTYNKTARNFNPIMAAAGRKTIVETEKLVEIGQLDPEFIHTPGIYVQTLIVGQQQKRIEKMTISTEL